nr:hypothetical protein [Rhodoferax sp.]
MAGDKRDMVGHWRQRLRLLRLRRRDETSMRQHRAMYQLRLHRGELLFAFLLPVASNLLLLLGMDGVIGFWRGVLDYLVPRLDFNATVVMRAVDLGLYDLWIPTVVVEGPLPSALTWWVTACICCVVFMATYLIKPNRGLPFVYILRAIVLLQVTALLYFAFIPASFPMMLEEYLVNNLFMGLCFLALVPWILGATYYLFDFSLLQKFMLTLLILTFFAVMLPFQYLLHANLVAHGSLLFMPVLYLVFGLFIDVMAFVALYSYGMSWRFRKT